MAHLYSVFKKNADLSTEEVLRLVGKEAAFRKLAELTGYTYTWVVKKYKILPCLKVCEYGNFRDIIVNLEVKE